MTNIVIFGAGGRAGRAVAGEAARRGHRVTAAVRDPSRAGVGQESAVRVVAADVTDASGVAQVAAEHDAAVLAAVDLAVPPDVFFPRAARAVGEGLALAGVKRLIVVGLASVLETAEGVALMDSPGYPQEYRGFYLGHQTLKDGIAASGLDWVVLSPAGDFDHGGGRTGEYRWGAADAASRVSYPDFAVAVLDEIERPSQHRTHRGVVTG